MHAAQPYAEGITDVVRNLQSAGGGSNSALLTPRDEVRNGGRDHHRRRPRSVRWLQLDRHPRPPSTTCATRNAGRARAIVTVGRKAEGYFRFRGYPIDAAFSGFSDSPTYEDARLVASAVVSRFEAGELDRCSSSTRGSSPPVARRSSSSRLLPLEPTEAATSPTEGPNGPSADYEFEPNPETILETLLPRYTESRVYAALLNAAASEHAARQRAMKAATDNAEELILTYRRRMNRARQDSITTEIMEIVGGAEALSQGAARPRRRASRRVLRQDRLKPRELQLP